MSHQWQWGDGFGIERLAAQTSVGTACGLSSAVLPLALGPMIAITVLARAPEGERVDQTASGTLPSSSQDNLGAFAEGLEVGEGVTVQHGQIKSHFKQ
ncbi:MAG: hypothetical protein V9G10_07595 [Candidatus Nanopelagicales bacterium]